MNPITLRLLAALLFLATRLSVWSHTFSLVVYDYPDTPSGVSLIQVTDGLVWINAPLVSVVAGGPTGEYDEFDNEIWARTKHTYSVTVPDLWKAEGRAVSFHIPGHALTPFFPMIEAGATHHYEVISQREWPNPYLPSTPVYNRVLIGNWWPNPPEAETDNPLPAYVTKLLAWDNNNPYWPCVGLDNVASTGHAYWRWMHPEGAKNAVAMELDYLHRLTLSRRSAATSTIVLDPEFGRILVNGHLVLTTENAANQLGGQNGGQFVVRSDAGLNLGSDTLLRPGQGGQSSQIVLGTYNDDRTDPYSGQSRLAGVLIVGSGDNTGNEPRKNGLRILDDGTVLIQPKGDLLMHDDFRKGPTP